MVLGWLSLRMTEKYGRRGMGGDLKSESPCKSATKLHPQVFKEDYNLGNVD